MRAQHHYSGKANQRGAALLIMLVIMVMGATTYLVRTLNSSTLNVARDKVTAEALAQAREALIGRAVADGTSPGSLPCPDTNDDGSSELFSGNNCPTYAGRLPWRTLGLTDLRDGSGERLWYALSPNFRDFVSANPINSDTLGTLNVSGTTAASNVIAIVFAPGNVISGQSRSVSQTSACATTTTTVSEALCATNYLEGSNANQSLYTAPNTSYQAAATSTTFNDQIIVITHDQLFAAVEKRIAREVKACLDEYAANAANKYPWATPVNDATYTGTFDTWFGRIPTLLNIDVDTVPTTDPVMSASWTSTCNTLFSASYWANWKNLVFYQVADGYQPGSSASFGTPLTINGSGTYRATVLVARQAIGGQVRSTSDSTTYLENINQHQTITTTTFETYNSSDSNYSTVNDLVLCLDGKVNCL